MTIISNTSNVESVECRGCRTLVLGGELIVTVNPRSLLRHRCACAIASPVVIVNQQKPSYFSGVDMAAKDNAKDPEVEVEGGDKDKDEVKEACPECNGTGKVQLFTSTQPCSLCKAKAPSTPATPCPFYGRSWAAPLIGKGWRIKNTFNTP